MPTWAWPSSNPWSAGAISRWIRDVWQGPIVIKGVHTGDDARRAIDAGADAIVVSNHGGRQLDGVAPTLRVLPEVIEAVDGRLEVLLDGGIRRGSDVVKALAMGARAVLVGRAYAYGLGAAGEAGVHRAIEILRSDVIRTLEAAGLPVRGGARSLLCRRAPGVGAPAARRSSSCPVRPEGLHDRAPVAPRGSGAAAQSPQERLRTNGEACFVRVSLNDRVDLIESGACFESKCRDTGAEAGEAGSGLATVMFTSFPAAGRAAAGTVATSCV